MFTEPSYINTRTIYVDSMIVLTYLSHVNCQIVAIQSSLNAMENTQNVKGNVMVFISENSASISAKQPSMLADIYLSPMMADMYSKAMSLTAETEAQQDVFILSCIRCVTERGTPISCYNRLTSTQEQCTALPRPLRYIMRIANEHDNAVLNLTAGLESFLSKCELSYDRKTLRDEVKPHNLTCEIDFLRQSLCSLLLQPMAGSEGRGQTRPQGVNAVRDVETDANIAEAEVKEQSMYEQTTKEVPNSGTTKYPMTTGHLEIQAVNEAVKEISNAILSLKNLIRDLPSQLSQDHHTILHNNLESVSREILRFPQCLTSLLVRRKAGLDATRKDRDAAAENLRAADETMAAAGAKEMELVAKTEAFERDKNAADERMKEATELLRAVETREKLVAGRERRVVGLEEEQALEDLNHGANAAMEDEAEAAAAEARESVHSTSPTIGLKAAVENKKIPTALEKVSNFPPASQHVLEGRDAAIAAKEEELWHRDNNLAFRETNLHLRETALFAREQLLEQMKMAQIQLTENWKAQVDGAYAGLEAEGEDMGAKFRALIALKGRVEETQGKARNLIGEARGMIGRGGEDAGGVKGA